jgi:hypothetical protein
MTAKGNATDLMHFISKQMRMSHIYQPVMIKTLLHNGGHPRGSINDKHR